MATYQGNSDGTAKDWGFQPLYLYDGDFVNGWIKNISKLVVQGDVYITGYDGSSLHRGWAILEADSIVIEGNLLADESGYGGGGAPHGIGQPNGSIWCSHVGSTGKWDCPGDGDHPIIGAWSECGCGYGLSNSRCAARPPLAAGIGYDGAPTFYYGGGPYRNPSWGSNAYPGGYRELYYNGDNSVDESVYMGSGGSASTRNGRDGGSGGGHGGGYVKLISKYTLYLKPIGKVSAKGLNHGNGGGNGEPPSGYCTGGRGGPGGNGWRNAGYDIGDTPPDNRLSKNSPRPGSGGAGGGILFKSTGPFCRIEGEINTLGAAIDPMQNMGSFKFFYVYTNKVDNSTKYTDWNTIGAAATEYDYMDSYENDVSLMWAHPLG